MFRKAFALPLAVLFTTLAAPLPAEVSRRAELSRFRNLGGAHYEEEEYEKAVDAFQQCLTLKSDSAIDEMNLGIALVQAGRYDDARKHLSEGEKLDASLRSYAVYNRAVSYKREKRFAEAVREFEEMRRLDKTCPDTAYNLAVVYESVGELNKAFDELTRAVELAPYQIAPHYRRMIVGIRVGKREIALAEQKIFMELRAADSRTRTPGELERSMYTEILEPERVFPTPTTIEKNSLGVKFKDVTAEVGLSLKGDEKRVVALDPLSWGDIDGDDRPDLLFLRGSSPGSLQVWRGRGDAGPGFENVSTASGLSNAPADAAAIALGDLDHDGDEDLCVSDRDGVHVFLNQGDGKFAETSGAIAVGESGPVERLLLVDFDHDGDLDLYAAPRSAAAKMFRNDGKGAFSSVSEEEALSGDGNPVNLMLFLDFDGDNDVDFFISHPETPNQLLSSLRMGKFQDVAGRLNVTQPANARSLAITDINNDSWPDILLLLEKGDVVALLGKRVGKSERTLLATIPAPGPALATFDYDNDGDEDLFVAGRLLQNDGKFTDVSEAVGLRLEKPGDLLQAVAEDFDRDGDLDLALCWRDGRLALLRNDGGNQNKWIRVNLEGLQSNRFGLSTKVEVRDGLFFQRKISIGRPLLFGLGEREKLDVLRLWWPTGVAQNVLDPKVGESVQVREKLGPPSSCPFVYLWDGGKFSFLTDVLDGTPLGVHLGKGEFFPCRSKEDLLIPGSKIRSKDGRLVIQLTSELRELVYLDKAVLAAVDHSPGTAVLPDECVGPPGTGESRLYSITNSRLPLSAKDDRGNDLRAVLSEADGRYADTFDLTKFHGLAKDHTLLLDFGDTSTIDRPLLTLSGWIEWIDGDTLYSLGQGAGPAPFGPALEMRRADGSWERVSEGFGVPAGLNKTVVIELPRRLCGKNTRLRILTNQEIYWDRAALGDAGDTAPRVSRLKLLGADLHFRGFSKVVRGDRSDPPWYNYGEVSAEAPYEPQQGFLTRYGDTIPLVSDADDRLVIFGPGDELTLTFALPPELSAGLTRDFILRLDGWIKDGNPSTFTGDRIDPLPYRAMKGYPFGAIEGIVDDPSYAEYISRYNTRSLNRDAASLRWSGESGF